MGSRVRTIVAVATVGVALLASGSAMAKTGALSLRGHEALLTPSSAPGFPGTLVAGGGPCSPE